MKEDKKITHWCSSYSRNQKCVHHHNDTADILNILLKSIWSKEQHTRCCRSVSVEESTKVTLRLQRFQAHSSREFISQRWIDFISLIPFDTFFAFLLFSQFDGFGLHLNNRDLPPNIGTHTNYQRVDKHIFRAIVYINIRRLYIYDIWLGQRLGMRKFRMEIEFHSPETKREKNGDRIQLITFRKQIDEIVLFFTIKWNRKWNWLVNFPIITISQWVSLSVSHIRAFLGKFSLQHHTHWLCV